MPAGFLRKVKSGKPVPVKVVSTKRRRAKKKTLLGNSFKTQLKYWSYADQTPATGTLQNQINSANGLYDVDITGVGHQPRGFDQLIEMYDHATVVKATCVAKFMIHNNDPPAYCVLRLKDNDTPDTSGTNALESRNVVYGMATSEKPLTLKLTFNAKQFFGQKDVVGEKDYQNSVSSNPSEQAYFHMSTFNLNSATYTDAINVAYTIYYDAVFTEPRNPAQS